MLEECINTIKSSYEQFLGSGMYFALFLVSMLYIFMKEKDKKKRILFIYFPIVIFAVITNPFFNLLSSVVFTVNTYYRLFWLLPLGIVIAYTAVLVVNEGKDKIEKIVIFVSLFVIIALSGKFYFDTKGTFVEFGNLYKLPDESVLVAQLIGIDEEEVAQILREKGHFNFTDDEGIDIEMRYYSDLEICTSNIYTLIQELADMGKQVIAVVLDYILKLNSNKEN